MTDFSLREIDDADDPWLIELHNDPVVLRNMTHPRPITSDDHARWREKLRNSSINQALVFCVDGVRAGIAKFVQIDADNRCCLLGADIHKDHRGNGYAKPLWRLMLDRCYLELNMHRVGLFTAEYNNIGRHVYSSLGFKEDGRLVEALYRDGIYWDMISMYLLRPDWEASRG